MVSSFCVSTVSKSKFSSRSLRNFHAWKKEKERKIRKSIGALVKYQVCQGPPPFTLQPSEPPDSLSVCVCVCTVSFSSFLACVVDCKIHETGCIDHGVGAVHAHVAIQLNVSGLKLHTLTWTIGFGAPTPESFLTRASHLAAGNVHQRARNGLKAESLLRIQDS